MVPSILGFGYFYRSVWKVREVRALGSNGVGWGEKVLEKKAVGKGRYWWPEQRVVCGPRALSEKSPPLFSGKHPAHPHLPKLCPPSSDPEHVLQGAEGDIAFCPGPKSNCRLPLLWGLESRNSGSRG